MKSLKYLFLLGFAVAALQSCKKYEIVPLPVTSVSGMANVKLVHASAYPTNIPVQFKVNGARVSNAITYSTPFPGGGLNTGGSSLPYYLSLNPGTNKIEMTFPRTGTNIDSVALFAGDIMVEADKHYTAYLADTFSKTQLVLVTDNTTVPAAGTSRYKFVHLMPNVPAADLYFGSTLVASNIAYKGVSAEFTLPTNTVDRWYVRAAGAAPTATPIASYPTTPTTQTIPNQKILTVFSRGYNGGTGNRLPAISLLYN